jgi:prefoldin subunit 5
VPDERQRPSPSSPPPRPRLPEEAYDRLQALETRVMVYEERVDSRLSHLAAAMQEMKTALSDLRPKRAAIVPWMAVAIAIGGIVFRAGNYPDRGELDGMRKAVVESIDTYRGEVRSLEKSLIELRGTLQALDRRLDDLMREREQRRPRK